MRKLDFRLDLGDSYLRLLEEKDIPELLELYKANANFLKPWEPTRSADFYTLDGVGYIVKADQDASRADEAYAFGLFLTENDRLIGRFRLSWIMRGVAETCNLGYFVSEEFNGKGFSTFTGVNNLRAYEAMTVPRASFSETGSPTTFYSGGAAASRPAAISARGGFGSSASFSFGE